MERYDIVGNMTWGIAAGSWLVGGYWSLGVFELFFSGEITGFISLYDVPAAWIKFYPLFSTIVNF